MKIKFTSINALRFKKIACEKQAMVSYYPFYLLFTAYDFQRAY